MPCKHYDPCSSCLAGRELTYLDWYLLIFYTKVGGQFTNIGGAMGAPLLVPNVRGMMDVAELHGYPEEDWKLLVDWAGIISNLVQKNDKVNWYAETGKLYRDVTPLDLEDPKEWPDEVT